MMTMTKTSKTYLYVQKMYVHEILLYSHEICSEAQFKPIVMNKKIAFGLTREGLSCLYVDT